MHEPTAGRATLAVLGAGPKGLAIAAKRAALARSGGEVPDLVLVDREGVAANWSGAAGYTDGRQRLSTAPEKDVGFPYAPTWGAASERVSQELGRWSWQSYLVHQEGFADWVDRGRPLPTHRQWSQYLRWVAAQVPAEPILAEVDGIDLAGGRWRLAARTPTGGRLDLDCDGLVLTGPGPPVRLPGQPDDHPRVLDGRNFWTSQDELARDGPVEVCVIGNGETAGSITAALLAMLPERSTIELVSDHGVLYSRGESFAENRLYSDPVAASRCQPAASSSSAPIAVSSPCRSSRCSTRPARCTRSPAASLTCSQSGPRSSSRSTMSRSASASPSTGWSSRSASTRCGSGTCSASVPGRRWRAPPTADPPPGRPPAPLSNAPSATTSPSRGCTPSSTCRS